MKNYDAEFKFTTTIRAESADEAWGICESILIHPQTSERMNPDYLCVERQVPTLADIDPAGAAVVAADAGPRA